MPMLAAETVRPTPRTPRTRCAPPAHGRGRTAGSHRGRGAISVRRPRLAASLRRLAALLRRLAARLARLARLATSPPVSPSPRLSAGVVCSTWPRGRDSDLGSALRLFPPPSRHTYARHPRRVSLRANPPRGSLRLRRRPTGRRQRRRARSWCHSRAAARDDDGHHGGARPWQPWRGGGRGGPARAGRARSPRGPLCGRRELPLRQVPRKASCRRSRDRGGDTLGAGGLGLRSPWRGR